MITGYKKTELTKTEKVLITPDVAKKMLEKNACNRKLSIRLIVKYAEDMLSGNWCQTHQGIAFDSIGNLVDGQHRLSAVVRSNTPVVFNVSYYEGEVLPFMVPLDRGKNRTFADLTGKSKSILAIANSLYGFVTTADHLNPFQTLNICNKIEKYDYRYKEVSGFSLNTEPKKDKKFRISSLEKSVFFIILLGSKNSNFIKRYFSDNMTENQEFYFDWKEDSGYHLGGTGSRNITAKIFYRLFSNDVFISPKQYDEIDNAGKELREKTLPFIQEFIR